MPPRFQNRILFLLFLGIFFNLCVVVVISLYLQRDGDVGSFKKIEVERSDMNDKSLIQNDNNNFNHNTKEVKIWIAGIILDAGKIRSDIWDYILNLNCEYNIGVHILTKINVEKAEKKRDFRYNILDKNKCAPILIQNQNNPNMNDRQQNNKITFDLKNRIDRISSLRDYQRSLLQNVFIKNNIKEEDDQSVIIIADLDLYKLPPIDIFIDQITRMTDGKSYPHDAICANGATLSIGKHGSQKRNPTPFYYDTFALVFLPDTFSHPLSRRLQMNYYHGEDPKLVRSNDQFGNFTQGDIWKYLVDKGRTSNTGNVRVKSCFGGLTIYKSSVYFREQCQYQLKKGTIERSRNDNTSIMKYASKKEERPCEHVVFHDCLDNVKSSHLLSFDIAINPNLVTLWRRD